MIGTPFRRRCSGLRSVGAGRCENRENAQITLLPKEEFELWLAGEAVRLGPAPEDLLVMHRVGRRVNNARDDDPECVAALAAA